MATSTDLNVTYKEDSNQSSNLGNILTGFSGTMSVIGQTTAEFGGVAGKKFAAAFTVVNGVISGVTQYGASDLSNEELEKAAVGTLVGYLAGAVSAVVLTAAGAPATVVIAAGGLIALGTGKKGSGHKYK